MRILYMPYNWIWDRILSIPYLLKMKEEWNKIYFLEHEKSYLNKIKIYKFLKENDLYEDVFIIPWKFINFTLYLIKFIIFNFRKFDLLFAPTRTLTTKWRWTLLAKKYKEVFSSLNDDSKFENIVDWTLWYKTKTLSSYSNNLKISYNNVILKNIWFSSGYITIYVGLYTRSLAPNQWINIINYVKTLWYKIILLWWKRESRINKYVTNDIINLIDKTSFDELCTILKNAEFTISANWWIMRLAHLLNPKSISFSITSWFITHPPVDNKESFHIWNKECKKPCEFWASENIFNKYWYINCIYKKRECLIRENITSINIIQLINKHILNK